MSWAILILLRFLLMSTFLLVALSVSLGFVSEIFMKFLVALKLNPFLLHLAVWFVVVVLLLVGRVTDVSAGQ